MEFGFGFWLLISNFDFQGPGSLSVKATGANQGYGCLQQRCILYAVALRQLKTGGFAGKPPNWPLGTHMRSSLLST